MPTVDCIDGDVRERANSDGNGGGYGSDRESDGKGSAMMAALEGRVSSDGNGGGDGSERESGSDGRRWRHRG